MPPKVTSKLLVGGLVRHSCGVLALVSRSSPAPAAGHSLPGGRQSTGGGSVPCAIMFA
ncbi:hypothetical protein ABH941_000044 [Streptacidiphilus sp. EB103A]